MNPADNGEFGRRAAAAAADRSEDGERSAAPGTRHAAAEALARLAQPARRVHEFRRVARRCSRCSRPAWRVYVGKREFDGPGPSTATTNFMVQAEHRRRRDRRPAGTARPDQRRPHLPARRPRLWQGTASLKAGEYEIKAGASMRDIMELLESGKSVLASLTIPEGLTVEQAFQRIAEHDGADRRHAGRDAAGRQPGRRHAALHARRDAPADHRQDAWPTRSGWSRASGAAASSGLPLADIDEFVTLASIVEKETGSSRRALARRRRLHQPAEARACGCSPTRPFIYGLFGGKGKPADRPIYQSDIDKPTPYNTYHDQRPAADADRQSRPRSARGRRQSVEDRGPLFRRRRHRRPRLRRDARRAQRERRPLAGGPEEAGRGSGEGRRRCSGARRRRSPLRPRRAPAPIDLSAAGGARAARFDRDRPPSRRGRQSDSQDSGTPRWPAELREGRGTQRSMNLQSMTGFARAAAEHDGAAIAWEVKSVNGKSVERAARACRPASSASRPAVAASRAEAVFARQFPGDADCRASAGGRQAQPVVNEAFLKDVAGLAQAAGGAVRRRAARAPTACWRCAACSSRPSRSRARSSAPRSMPLLLAALEDGA